MSMRASRTICLCALYPLAQLVEMALERLAIEKPRQRVELAVIQQGKVIAQDSQNTLHEIGLARRQGRQRFDDQQPRSLAAAVDRKDGHQASVSAVALHHFVVQSAFMPRWKVSKRGVC